LHFFQKNSQFDARFYQEKSQTSEKQINKKNDIF